MRGGEREEESREKGDDEGAGRGGGGRVRRWRGREGKREMEGRRLEVRGEGEGGEEGVRKGRRDKIEGRER